MRLFLVLWASCLAMSSASWASSTQTKSEKPAKSSAKGGSLRDLLSAPTLDSNQWYFWNFEGSQAKKTITSSFRSQRPAVNIETTRLGPHLWNIQFSQAVPSPLAKGQILRLHFWGRSLTNNPMATFFGHNDYPYEGFLNASVILTPQWREYALVFKLSQDIPKDWATLNFLLGYKVGSIELADITLEDWGVDPKPYPRSKNAYQTVFLEPAPTKEFYKEAEARIESIRKGDLAIKVTDEKGAPVAHATVKVSQLRHKFRFGTGISSAALLDPGPNGQKYRETILKLFNAVVPDNALKWEAQDYDLPDTADRMVAWCKANNLPVRGHNLLWPKFFLLPKSVRDLRGRPLRDAIHKHVTDYVTKYRGRIYVWDVINEAIDNHDVQDNLGEGILADCFKLARQADPSVGLAYSDYNILNNNAGANDHCRAAGVRLIEGLIKAQAPINMLADQGHMTIPLTHGDKIMSILDEWAKFKMPIEITEYELAVSDDAIHAKYLKEFLTSVFSHPAVDGFFMLVFWDGSQWLGDEGRAMFRQDWTPRPTVGMYKDLVFKKWWTNASAKSNDNGAAKFRVFLGEHEITVRKGNRVVSSKVLVEDNKAGEKTVTLVLPAQ